MHFCFNEFVVGVNNSIFPGNEQQKVYIEQRKFSTDLSIHFYQINFEERWHF